MISIRPAMPEEANILSQIAIAAKSHWNYPIHWMERWIPQLTFSPTYFDENESWVAEMDDEPIAFSTLQERDGNAWLENIWVLPAHIGQGVGKQLFRHALDRARERGHQSLQLEAEPNAVGFYEKMGMKKVGEHQYELDGQPRSLPLMEMDL